MKINMSPRQEQSLIERAKTDSQAFGTMFETYYGIILNYIIRRTGNVSLSQDITSEVFIKVIDALPKYQWRGIPFSAWLYRIADSQLGMYYRKNKKLTSLEAMQEMTGFEPIVESDISEELQNAQSALDRQLQYKEARQLINKLPERYHVVITLRFGEQKKIKEIAQIIGKREGTVKSLLSRALHRLRKEMSNNKMQPNANKYIIASEGQEKLVQEDE